MFAHVGLCLLDRAVDRPLDIITGRPAAKTGRAGRQAIAKIVIRSVVLFALGTALALAGTPIEVILANFGLYFLLALPFVRLRAPPSP